MRYDIHERHRPAFEAFVDRMEVMDALGIEPKKVLAECLNELRDAIGNAEIKAFLEDYNTQATLDGRPDCRLVGPVCPV